MGDNQVGSLLWLRCSQVNVELANEGFDPLDPSPAAAYGYVTKVASRIAEKVVLRWAWRRRIRHMSDAKGPGPEPSTTSSPFKDRMWLSCVLQRQSFPGDIIKQIIRYAHHLNVGTVKASHAKYLVW